MLRNITETAAPIDNDNSNRIGALDEAESGGNDDKGAV
jgi:hypothetical protein